MLIHTYWQPANTSSLTPSGSSLQEMLVLLWKKGPTTEGVFRKTGNSKNLKIYREQLNCGEDVDMENLPVVILVGLLKVNISIVYVVLSSISAN